MYRSKFYIGLKFWQAVAYAAKGVLFIQSVKWIVGGEDGVIELIVDSKLNHDLVWLFLRIKGCPVSEVTAE